MRRERVPVTQLALLISDRTGCVRYGVGCDETARWLNRKILSPPMTSTHDSLEDLGWRTCFSEQLTDGEVLRCHPVRVMAVHRGKLAVAGAEGERFITPYIPGAHPSDDHPTAVSYTHLTLPTNREV